MSTEGNKRLHPGLAPMRRNGAAGYDESHAIALRKRWDGWETGRARERNRARFLGEGKSQARRRSHGFDYGAGPLFKPSVRLQLLQTAGF